MCSGLLLGNLFETNFDFRLQSDGNFDSQEPWQPKLTSFLAASYYFTHMLLAAKTQQPTTGCLDAIAESKVNRIGLAESMQPKPKQAVD